MPRRCERKMIEVVIEILAEIFLQIGAELLAEVGVHAVVEPFRKSPQPWLAAVGYALFGAAAGALSLFVFPFAFIHTPMARVLNLSASPVAAGTTMYLLGRWRSRRRQVLVRLDRFAYGFLFALCMALVRFCFAH